MAIVQFKLGHIDAFKKATTITQASGSGITRSGSWTVNGDYYYTITPADYITFDFTGTGIKFYHYTGNYENIGGTNYNYDSTVKIEIAPSETNDAFVRYPNVNMKTTAVSSSTTNTTIDMNLPYGTYKLKITHNGVSGEILQIGSFVYYDKVNTTIRDTAEAFAFTVNPSEMSNNPDFGEVIKTSSGRNLKNTIGIPTNTITIKGMKIDKYQRRKMELFAQRDDTLVLVDDRDGGDNIHIVRISNFQTDRRKSTYSELESYIYSMVLEECFII